MTSMNPVVSRGLLIIALCFAQTGCGWFFGDKGVFRNRSNDYLKAEKTQPLVLPEGKQSASMGDIYPVPAISATDFGYDPSMEYEVPRPLPLAANSREEKVRIQRVGGESWVLINAAPGELWPRIRNFLNVNGLNASYSNINKGIIETEWLQFKTDPALQHTYRLQIDQGVQPETSEIHILHYSISASEALPADVNWPQKSVNPEREKWLMDELAATLANDTSEGTSLLAQNIGGSVKANLGMMRTEPVMYIRLDRVRSFATLGYAAKQDGFLTFESDTEAGVYYVGYKDPEDMKPGWFKRALHLPHNPKLPTTEYSLAQLKEILPQGEALDNLPLSKRGKEKVLPDADGYLLIVTGEKDKFVVRIRDPYGKRLAPKEARQFLTILRKNLI